MTSSALVSFTYDEHDYTIPSADEWSVDVIEAFEDGKTATLLRALLGASQWSAFKSKPRTMTDLNGIFEAANKALDSGN